MKFLLFINCLLCFANVSIEMTEEGSTALSKQSEQNNINKRVRSLLFPYHLFPQTQRVSINTTELLRRIDLAKEKARKQHEMKLEEERRQKIFAQYLASRVQSSFIRDFHTWRY